MAASFGFQSGRLSHSLRVVAWRWRCSLCILPCSNLPDWGQIQYQAHEQLATIQRLGDAEALKGGGPSAPHLHRPFLRQQQPAQLAPLAR